MWRPYSVSAVPHLLHVRVAVDLAGAVEGGSLMLGGVVSHPTGGGRGCSGRVGCGGPSGPGATAGVEPGSGAVSGRVVMGT